MIVRIAERIARRIVTRTDVPSQDTFVGLEHSETSTATAQVVRP